MELIIRQDNTVGVASDTLYLYPEFKKLLKTYGNDDYILNKIISYIFFTSDPKAVPQKKGYNKKEAHKYAIKQAGLDEKFKVTDDIIKAQKAYSDSRTNDAIQYITNIISSLRLANKLCDAIINKQSIDDEELSDEKITSISNSIKEVLTLSSKVNEAIPKLKDNIKLLKSLELEDEEEVDTLRGGQPVLESHFGNSEIEQDD